MAQTGANSKNHSNHTAVVIPQAVVIIPARFASSRLPGKALLEINGKPMVCRVADRAREAKHVSRVIVATDDRRIVDAVEVAGHEAVITRSDHRSGTDRLAEVAATLDDTEIIVNVQGDDHLFPPRQLIARLKRSLGETARTGETPTQRNEILRKEAETYLVRIYEDLTVERAGIATTWERIDSATRRT